MKNIILILSLLFLMATKSYPQVYSLSSNDPNYVINGERNIMLIKSAHDSLDLKVRVSSGTIERQPANKWEDINHAHHTFRDTNYAWQVCADKHEFQKVYLDYYENEKLICSDTFYFGLMAPSDFSPSILFHSTKVIKAYKPEDLTTLGRLKNEDYLMDLTLFTTNNLEYSIKEFSVKFYRNDSLIGTFRNYGSAFLPKLRNYMIENSDARYYIFNVIAETRCGMELSVPDSGMCIIEY